MYVLMCIQEKRNRTITQYQFISWPDHGVPDEPTPALDFVRVVHEVAPTTFGPIVVHCRYCIHYVDS